MDIIQDRVIDYLTATHASDNDIISFYDELAEWCNEQKDAYQKHLNDDGVYDPSIFYDATLDFFYDRYFKEHEGHDWDDEAITGSVQQDDIDKCLDLMRETLYKHFGVKATNKEA